MQCALMSDLHYEFYGSDSHVKIPTGTEVLILAGDISDHRRLHGVLTHYSGVVSYVVFVPGNHEHYGLDAIQGLETVQATAPKNVFWLRPKSTAHIGGVVFAGDTLWFGDYDGLNQIYERHLPDFRAIRVPGKHVSNWIYDKHKEAVKFLTRTKADVFVTHHLPSPVLTHPNYHSSPINRFFSSEVFEKVQHPPKFWCYGHTHLPHDGNLGETRFLCNPRGYPNENGGVYTPLVFTV